MPTCRWAVVVVFTAVAVPAAPMAWAAGACDALTPCAARLCRLDADIAKAKDRGDAKAVTALQHQRADMVHCSDEGAKEKRKMALQQAQARVDKREAELTQAEATKDPAKIKKAQKNLDSAKRSYAEMEKSPL